MQKERERERKKKIKIFTSDTYRCKKKKHDKLLCKKAKRKGMRYKN